MPGITLKSTYTYAVPSCVSAIDDVIEITKKPLLAVGLTTLMIMSVQPKTINSKPETQRSITEAVKRINV